jgi:lipopolysaccharide export LptBFGC system permease protein LptF
MEREDTPWNYNYTPYVVCFDSKSENNLGFGGIGTIIVGIIALIVIIAIIVFLVQLLAPVIAGLLILAIIVGVGLWIYGKIKRTT